MIYMSGKEEWKEGVIELWIRGVNFGHNNNIQICFQPFSQTISCNNVCTPSLVAALHDIKAATKDGNVHGRTQGHDIMESMLPWATWAT